MGESNDNKWFTGNEIEQSTMETDTAAQIQVFARSIWQGFYQQRMAPEKWGDAFKEVRDTFIHDMEKKWFVLRLCENHWKTNTVAASIYSQ